MKISQNLAKLGQDYSDTVLTHSGRCLFSAPFCMPSFMHVQGSFYSNAVKSLITLSTIILLGLVIAYHGLQAQVGRLKWCSSRPTRTYQTYQSTLPNFLIWTNLCDLVYQRPTRCYRSQIAFVAKLTAMPC